MKLPDLWLFIPALLLSIFGLVVISSVAPSDFSFQLQILVFSLILFFIISQIDIELIRIISVPIYIVVNLLLVFILIFTDPIRGSRRWIEVFGFNFQISEFAKIGLLTLLAYLAPKFSTKNFLHFLYALFLILLPVLLIFLEPDLGSAILVGLIGFVAILGLNFKKRFIILLLLVALIAMPLFYKSLAVYQKARITNYLNKNENRLGANYNQIQAEIAIGSGQIWGRGLGRGTQSHLQFLPEKQTDFIFASIAEEFGFMGVVVISSLFLLISHRLLSLSSKTKTKKIKIIFLGSFVMIFGQYFIHAGINLGLLPVTGLTLPFLSVGGSSIFTNWLVLAICSSASHTIKNKEVYVLV